METTDRKLRMPEDLRAEVEASAKAEGHSMNSEMVGLLRSALDAKRDAVERDRTLADAMVLAYGPDNGPMLHLLGEVLRLLAPRGEWRDDATIRASLTRGFVQVFRRLAAPTDGHFIDDKSPEGQIDRLLLELGDDGSAHPGALTHLQRWAAERRRRLGDLGPLLIDMHRVVKQTRQAMPPGDPPKADPEKVASWGQAFDAAAERPPQEGEG